MNEHLRANDEEDEPRVHSRKGDFGAVNKLNKFLDDFKIIWIIGFPLLIAFGFNFRTPGSQFEELQSSDKKQVENQELMKSSLIETNKVLAVLVFLKCEEIKDGATKNRIVEFQLNCIEVFKNLTNSK